MKRTNSSIFDLDIDALRYIMVCLGKSAAGYADIARVTSVCQDFKELVAEEEVLKSVAFETSVVRDEHESFWNLNGLLTKCARLGNKTACYVLIKRVREQFKSKDMIMMIDSFNLAVKDFHDKTRAVKGTSARSEEAALAWEVVVRKGHEIYMRSNLVDQQSNAIGSGFIALGKILVIDKHTLSSLKLNVKEE